MANEYTVVVEFTDGTAVTEVLQAQTRYNAMSMAMLRARVKQQSVDLESVSVVMTLTPAQVAAEEDGGLPGYAGPAPDGVNYSDWLAMNNID